MLPATSGSVTLASFSGIGSALSFMNRLGLRPGGIKSQIGLNEMLLGGDIILEVVGIQVSESCYPSIERRLSQMKPGDMITVKVLRAGRILELSATWGR